MQSFWNVTLWIAGAVAILGALGIARLEFALLFVQIDALMLAIGVVCLSNAYFRRPKKQDDGEA
nr:MAG: hypothetical protein E4H34_02230 [Hyphomicrobiales bacterium]